MLSKTVEVKLLYYAKWQGLKQMESIYLLKQNINFGYLIR